MNVRATASTSASRRTPPLPMARPERLGPSPARLLGSAVIPAKAGNRYSVTFVLNIHVADDRIVRLRGR